MSGHFDVIVIGVGTAGSAACYHLARRGVRVLGLEQFDIPNTFASHHGFSRMIRLCYFEHPDYVPLLRRAYLLWRELEQAIGRDVLHITGGLYMGPPGSEVVEGCLRSVQTHGLSHEVLSRHDLAKRFPQFRVPDDYTALLDHDAGYVLPERAVSAHVELALCHRAEIHAREPVQEWSASPSEVTVITSRGTYRAARAIFCGGAWMGKLVRDLGIDLHVTRQILAWVWPKTPALFERGVMPVWLLDQLGGRIHYGFPMMADNPGFKLACHTEGTPADPDRLDRAPRPEDEANIRSFLRAYIPAADGPLLGLRACMYTKTRDEDFVIDRHPLHENVIVASPCSGHGFKFQPVLGEALSDLAIEGKTALPVGFMRIGRFAQ